MPASSPAWDVIVAGLGAVGSAALYQLARRGVRALGFDRFVPPHDRGSSHGDTRITRLALGEGAHYFQFARRSHEVWRELEELTGEHLLAPVGALIYGSTTVRLPAHGARDFLATTVSVARDNGLSHEVLDASALRRRFPQFRFRDDETGCLEHGGGYVRPERCIAAQLTVATRLGAEVRTGESLRAFRRDGDGLIVETDRGTHRAARLILATGSWLPEIARNLPAGVKVFRQVLHWFTPDGPSPDFGPDRMPVFIRVPDAGTPMFYGFPAIDGPRGGLKIAGEQFELASAPDRIGSDVTPEESAMLHAAVASHVRLLPECVRSVVCKYTVTPDFDFILDRHPELDGVWLASACSGHGFKHSAGVGEALAELAASGGTAYDLGRFRLGR